MQALGGDGGRGDAQPVQAIGPEGLVSGEGQDDGGPAGACGGVRGAGAAVMDDGGHFGE